MLNIKTISTVFFILYASLSQAGFDAIYKIKTGAAILPRIMINDGDVLKYYKVILTKNPDDTFSIFSAEALKPPQAEFDRGIPSTKLTAKSGFYGIATKSVRWGLDNSIHIIHMPGAQVSLYPRPSTEMIAIPPVNVEPLAVTFTDHEGFYQLEVPGGNYQMCFKEVGGSKEVCNGVAAVHVPGVSTETGPMEHCSLYGNRVPFFINGEFIPNADIIEPVGEINCDQQ